MFVGFYGFIRIMRSQFSTTDKMLAVAESRPVRLQRLPLRLWGG